MRIAVYGYGNLGKGIEKVVSSSPDIELVGIFTRRNPDSLEINSDIPVYSADRILEFRDKIDVLMLCGGSATDLPVMTPALAENFNVVDSYDNHSKIPLHFEKVDAAAKGGKKLALISAGWDPGLFSLARVYFSSVLPDGTDYTFWGKGVSQGHSDAIRHIEGVVDARQYTIPVEESLNAVRNGETPTLSARQKHKRDCYVVAEDGADKAEIERKIKTMPAYFADYDTTVNFITLDELRKNHAGMPHGGSVIRVGKTGDTAQVAELKLTLGSNPEFTAGVLIAGARAVYKMHNRGVVGAITMLDIAPADLSPKSSEELRKNLL
jgi:diaminopimelate dehydrogenase